MGDNVDTLLALSGSLVVEKACANPGNFVLSQLLVHGHDVRVLDLPKAPVPLHCMAASAGFEQRMNEIYSWDGLNRGSSPFVVVQHTLTGEGRLDYAGVQHRLAPGDTMVLTMPHAHRYWLERGGRWDYFWIVLNGREALRLAREIIDARGPVLRPPSSVVDRMAAGCLMLLERQSIAPGEASVAAYGVMAALHDAAFIGQEEASPVLAAPLRRVINYIEQNLSAALQVEQLAAMAEMSRGHFVRQFSAAMGSPPSEWVVERRIERIERLLVATDLSVAAIAQATGFADGNYLAKAFRRRRGMAPVEFRRRAREQLD